MKTIKKIDQIYREKFQGVETTPPADVWQNISSRLPEKKSRKLLPFWYQLAGAAAAIALIFFLFNKNTSNSNQPEITSFQKNIPIRELDVNISSTAFEDIMTRSSNILNAAIMDTKIELIKAQFQTQIPQTQNSEVSYLNESSGAGITVINRSSDIENKENVIQNSGSKSILGFDGSLPVSPKSEAMVNTSEVTAEENPLEQIASANRSEKEITNSEKNSKRFSVTPTAAAVYFDTRNGNTLDNQFSNNTGGGEISMSYGVNLAYQISDKVKIRSGINNVNLGYSTKNVNYASARSSAAITPQDNAIIQTSSVSGSLNQEFNFLEIPLEIEYTLVDKKIGLNLIGGASTFFLGENNVVLESPNFTAEIGEANNLNQTSFSANLGVGLNYYISSHFQFNLEPIVKYQFNTFTSNSNLKSYYFGIYSGLSFNF